MLSVSSNCCNHTSFITIHPPRLSLCSVLWVLLITSLLFQPGPVHNNLPRLHEVMQRSPFGPSTALSPLSAPSGTGSAAGPLVHDHAYQTQHHAPTGADGGCDSALTWRPIRGISAEGLCRLTHPSMPAARVVPATMKGRSTSAPLFLPVSWTAVVNSPGRSALFVKWISCVSHLQHFCRSTTALWCGAEHDSRSRENCKPILQADVFQHFPLC